MAVLDQDIGEHYAIYNGDCIEVMQDLPKESVHFSIGRRAIGAELKTSYYRQAVKNLRAARPGRQETKQADLLEMLG